MSLSYLEWAFKDCQRVELVHQLPGHRFARGVYDDIDRLRVDAAARLSSGNLFISLNMPRETQPYAIRLGSGLGNDDMVRIVRLLFDFDPVRPPGVASTDAELALARAKAYQLEAFLSAFGWPLPARALSGNGVHRIYRVALPASEETAEQLRLIYLGLADLFSDEYVSFDVSVRNPGRICTLYGSTKRKGDPTPERPHRQSQIIVPQSWEQVSHRSIEAVANHFRSLLPAPVKPGGSARNPFQGRGADFNSLDIVALFQAQGLYFRADSNDPQKHFVRCPWEADHSSRANRHSKSTVIWETPSGQFPNFYCAHDHCHGRGIRDVLDRFDVAAYCRDQLGADDA
jgi:hypothetical protein